MVRRQAGLGEGQGASAEEAQGRRCLSRRRHAGRLAAQREKAGIPRGSGLFRY